MAKFRPAGRKKTSAQSQRPNAVGCIILLVLLFLLGFLSIYYTVKQG